MLITIFHGCLDAYQVFVAAVSYMGSLFSVLINTAALVI